MKPLSIFTRYDRLGASSRLRYFIYERYLRKGGYAPEYHYFYSNEYLQALYKGKTCPCALPAAWFRRLKDLIKIRKNVVIEYELLPFLPYFVDAAFLSRCRYIVNFDDNVWEKYVNIPFLRNKLDKIVRNAAGVIAANDYLFNKVSTLNNNVIKIRTVPDAASYNYKLPKFEKFTVAWIGTPVTYRYLEAFADTLRAMNAAVDFELLVIASAALKPIQGVNMRCVDWSPEVEFGLLCCSHVGIMPLTDDQFSMGKSSFKIIQYFAAGIPPIASPVGENSIIIRDGVNGFTPNTPEQWVEAIKKLYDDSYRSKISENIKISSENLTIQHCQQQLLDFFDRIFV